MFIVFEGVDGSGKSTQARLLAERLTSEGEDVVLTREPGGTPAAEELRGVILSGNGGNGWTDMTEVLLFNAARAEHVENKVRPALDAGRLVVSDRFALSTFAYQGMRSAALRDKAMRIHETAIGLDPDLTFILEAPDAGRNLAQRIRDGGETNRLDDRTILFQKELWERMIESAPYFEASGFVIRIPHGSIEEVAERVRDAYVAVARLREPERDADASI